MKLQINKLNLCLLPKLTWLLKGSIICSLIFIVFLNSLLATNYYFSNTVGNDTWSGRLAQANANNSDGPKKTLNAFNTLINSVARPGDSLFFRRGDQWTGNSGIVVNAAQGTPQQNIFVGAYGVGTAPLIQKSGTGEILLCRGSSNASATYIHFKELQLTSQSAVGSRPVGVYINESFYTPKPHHILLDGLYISGCQNGMILYQNDIVVQNCTLEKNGNQAQGQGIFCSATNVLFKNNVLDSNGCGSVFVHSIYISQSKNISFVENEIKNADDGLKLRASENLFIQRNRIHDTYIHTIHIGGDESSGTKNAIIENNLIYNAPQGLRISSESGTQTQLSENIIVRNNIFPAQVFISDNGPVKDIFFYNNLIHTGNNQPALLFINAIDPVNLQIKNNIFYKTTANTNHSLVYFNTGFTGISLDHNLYYFPASSNNLINVRGTAYKSLSAFRLVYPDQEINGQNGNPNFVSAPTDFHLTANSVLAIDKGADLIEKVPFDFEGMARPIDGDGMGSTAWDIGPYEYCCWVKTKDESKPEIALHVFPNPAQQTLHIQKNNSNICTIFIYDRLGCLMYKSLMAGEQLSIHSLGLASGYYLLECRELESALHKSIPFFIE